MKRIKSMKFLSNPKRKLTLKNNPIQEQPPPRFCNLQLEQLICREIFQIYQ